MSLTLEQKVAKGLILSPDTEAVVSGYKLPLKRVDKGYGYQGALTTNDKKTHIQCHLCGYFFKHLGIHLAKFHKVDPPTYKKQYGLAGQTSLVSENTRVALVEASEKVSWFVKRKRLKALAKGRILGSKREGTYLQKSLEQKNKEGRCPDQLIEKIIDLEKQLGRTPSGREFREHYGGYLGSIYDTYGSWANAVRIANLSPARVGLPQTYSKELLIEILRDFYISHHREPSFSDMRNSMMPSQWTFTRYFGSWSRAKKAAYGRSFHI